MLSEPALGADIQWVGKDGTMKQGTLISQTSVSVTSEQLKFWIISAKNKGDEKEINPGTPLLDPNLRLVGLFKELDGKPLLISAQSVLDTLGLELLREEKSVREGSPKDDVGGSGSPK